MGEGMDSYTRLREVASRQYWAFATGQARAAGLSRGQLATLVGRGEIERVHLGVMRFVSGERSPLQPIMSALLACGPRAVASHQSAADVWGFEAPAHDLVVVSVPHARHPSLEGVEVHRTKTLRRSDWTVRRGIAATNPARTLLDLCSSVDELCAELALDQALREGLASVPFLQGFVARPELAHAAGAGVLRKLLSYRAPGRAIGGKLETRFFRLLRAARLPLPVPQLEVLTLPLRACASSTTPTPSSGWPSRWTTTGRT
jgi:hypothetical protein